MHVTRPTGILPTQQAKHKLVLGKWLIQCRDVTGAERTGPHCDSPHPSFTGGRNWWALTNTGCIGCPLCRAFLLPPDVGGGGRLPLAEAVIV